MIGDYLVVALVFGIAGSFVFIIHHFWLRDAFKEEIQQSVPVNTKAQSLRRKPQRENQGDYLRCRFPV